MYIRRLYSCLIVSSVRLDRIIEFSAMSSNSGMKRDDGWAGTLGRNPEEVELDMVGNVEEHNHKTIRFATDFERSRQCRA